MNAFTRREFFGAGVAGLAMLALPKRILAQGPASGPAGNAAAWPAGAAASAPAQGTQAGAAGSGGNGKFFRVAKTDGQWWLLDPQGQRFLSKGVTTVQFAQDSIKGTNTSPYGETNQAKYGSRQAWRETAARRLLGWGFNTLGAWSDEKLVEVAAGGKHLAYAPTLDLGAKFVAAKGKQQAWLQGVFPDVFDGEFEVLARKIAVEQCKPRKDDPSLLGWFTDNELRWGPDWRGTDDLLTAFLNLPAGAPGRVAAGKLLRQRYDKFEKFNDVWKTAAASWEEFDKGGAIKPPYVRKEVFSKNEGAEERKANEADPKRALFVADCRAFLEILAEQYFRITKEAIHAADPNHMDFGCRFAWLPDAPVVKAAGQYLDAISFNCYDTDPRGTIAKYGVFGKPVIIGEFSFRSEDSGLPNTQGAGPKVKTQALRAAAYEQYVQFALSDPHVVGWHWFEHADEPKEGRFDGENSNYGLVNIKDEVYEELTGKMTEVNAQAEKWHAASR
jgi:agarase